RDRAARAPPRPALAPAQPRRASQSHHAQSLSPPRRMSIPSTPIPVGHTIAGATSWFGGPHDPSDSGHTASGLPEGTPGGIAVYNRATLGGYWRVRFPNGRTLIERQVDLGPAPWTGKILDVSYGALARAGYTEQNFPTGGHVTATYLGKNA